MEKEIEFDKQDWAAMHDAFMHVTGRKPSQEELEALFAILPHDMSEFHKNVERLANLIERAKQSPPEQRPTS